LSPRSLSLPLHLQRLLVAWTSKSQNEGGRPMVGRFRFIRHAVVVFGIALGE
jgi:hypothetical protein